MCLPVIAAPACAALLVPRERPPAVTADPQLPSPIPRHAVPVQRLQRGLLLREQAEVPGHATLSVAGSYVLRSGHGCVGCAAHVHASRRLPALVLAQQAGAASLALRPAGHYSCPAPPTLLVAGQVQDIAAGIEPRPQVVDLNPQNLEEVAPGG